MIASRPTVRQLKPASINLAKATPNLSKTFGVLNHLFNMLGYNPGDSPSGGQHGYLWWLAWLDHNVRTLFSIQDANGVFRPLFLQASCASLTQIANGISGSALLLNLSPILGASLPGGGTTGSGVCPRTRAPPPPPACRLRWPSTPRLRPRHSGAAASASSPTSKAKH